jgi:hypothetical protein
VFAPKLIGVLSFAAVLALSSPAAAEVISYTGTTLGGPTWNRPNTGNPPTTLSGFATNVPYSAFTFSPTQSGNYNFLSLGTNPVNWDNFLVLYAGAFNPATPLANVVIANDDFPTIGRAGFNNVPLTAGQSYTLVTTGFGNANAGAFTNSIILPQTSSFSGTTAGGPTWNRPIAGTPPTTLSGLATDVPYQVTEFQVSASGLYNFLNLATNPLNWDNYTFLYQGSFNPSAPLANVLIGNDDFPGIGQSGFNNVLLTAGQTYFFVTTGFDNSDFGAFSTSVTGPGLLLFPTQVIPEPATLGVFCGLVGVCGLAARRRKLVRM